MNLFIIAVSIILEASYMFICIKCTKSSKIMMLNFALFGGIILSNMAGIVANGTAFRHLMTTAITFIVVKLVYRDIEDVFLLDYFVISAVFFMRDIFEMLYVLGVVAGVYEITSISYMIANTLMIASVIIPVILIKRLYHKLKEIWLKPENFYIKYLCCVLGMVGISVFIKATIKYMEVYRHG